MECRICNICDRPSTFEESRDIASVPCNVRQFRDESFTVWRSSIVCFLHSLKDINLATYYEKYPMQRQKAVFSTRRLFASRLSQLKRGGIQRKHSVLDYGCGNGQFVEFLREHGYEVAGYD